MTFDELQPIVQSGVISQRELQATQREIQAPMQETQLLVQSIALDVQAIQEKALNLRINLETKRQTYHFFYAVWMLSSLRRLYQQALVKPFGG